MFWAKVTERSNDVRVNEPVLPRRRKRPQRYEEGTSDGHHPREVEYLYRPIYYEALDLITNGIKQRFDQPGYEKYSNLEELLVKAANKQDYKKELAFVANFYNSDFKIQELDMQLGIMGCSLPRDTNQHSLASVLECL